MQTMPAWEKIGHAAPFYFFDDFGIGGVDEFANTSECFAAPVGEIWRCAHG